MIIKSEIVEIGTEKAQYFLQNYSYEHERKIRLHHIRFLATQMEKGRFDSTAQIAFAVLGDLKFLVNGYHTLNAIVKSHTTQFLNVTYHKVNSYEEVGILYGHYDVNLGRTTSDYLRAINLGEKINLKKWQLDRAGAAIKYMKSGFGPTSYKGRIAGEDLARYISLWEKEIHFLFELHKDCFFAGDDIMRLRVLIAPVFSVSLIIAKYCPEDTIDFFSLMATDDGLKVGDPRKTLHKYLVSTARSNVAVKSISNGHLSRAVAKSWNYWMNGKSLSRMDIKTHHIQDNIIIDGTPFDGTLKVPENLDD